MTEPNVDYDDLNDDFPLAKDIAKVLTLEIQRYLQQQNETGDLSTNKTLTVVSQEFSTPIASLKTILQMLQRRLESDPQKFNFEDNASYVAFTLREIDKLTVLVNDLLDFNRINRGALEFNFVNIDVQPTITRVVERMKILCHTHTITYVGKDISFVASLDAPRFEQALDNIVSNAIKYSPDKSIILVNTKTNDVGVVITIQNQGEGIPKNEQAHLFEPYYRTPTAEAGKVGGLGIGLFISKQIVEAHRGTIALTSKTGEGATVTIVLPIPAFSPPGEVTHRKNTPLPMPEPPVAKTHKKA